MVERSDNFSNSWTLLYELLLLKEERERQKEQVKAIVQQCDMYRLLLAQSNPLPANTSQVQAVYCTILKLVLYPNTALIVF